MKKKSPLNELITLNTGPSCKTHDQCGVFVFLLKWHIDSSQICVTTKDQIYSRIVARLNSAAVSPCDFAELSNPLIHNGLLWRYCWYHYPRLEAHFSTHALQLLCVYRLLNAYQTFKRWIPVHSLINITDHNMEIHETQENWGINISFEASSTRYPSSCLDSARLLALVKFCLSSSSALWPQARSDFVLQWHHVRPRNLHKYSFWTSSSHMAGCWPA